MSVAGRGKAESRIPEFKSYEEEADFWDRHSPEEFPDEFEDIEVTVATAALREGAGAEERRRLINALSNLSDVERQATALVLLGLTESEIGRILGINSQQCARAIHRARSRIATFALASED